MLEENFRISFSENYFEKISDYINTIDKILKTKIILSNYVLVDDGLYGNFSSKIKHAFIYQLRRLNIKIHEFSERKNNVYINDIACYQLKYSFSLIFDENMRYLSNCSFSLIFIDEIILNISKIIESCEGKTIKLIICDLDNTIWGGIVSEDGVENLIIDKIGAGKVFYDLQIWLKELKKRGIMLAVCSKNDIDTALEPFEKISDMVLKKEDFLCFEANWDDKVANIERILKKLNIKPDSTVFLDDNPFERERVKSCFKDITVPDLPENPSEYLSFLRKLNIFELCAFSSEDKDRHNRYSLKIRAENEKRKFKTVSEYLTDLNMNLCKKEIEDLSVQRISQLFFRTNQFNLSGKRFSEKFLLDIIKEENIFCWYFSLYDRLGEHGIIAAIVFSIKEKTMNVDNIVISCRVLERTVEYYIMNLIIDVCKEKKLSNLNIIFKETEKNKRYQKIFLDYGLIYENGVYSGKLENLKKHKTYIGSVPCLMN